MADVGPLVSGRVRRREQRKLDGCGGDVVVGGLRSTVAL